MTQETRWRALVALHVLVLAGTAHALTIEAETARIRTVGAAGLVFRRDSRKVLALLEGLEDHDDVQKVHSNFDVAPEVLEKLQAG